MKKNWELEDLIEHFTLLSQEMRLIGNKTGETRLGFAVLLKFFQYQARFPYMKNEVPREVINYIAKQLNLSADLYKEYDWNGRSIKYHRAQIREYVGFRECTLDDIKQVLDWLRQEVLTHDLEIEWVKEKAVERFRNLQIEPPAAEHLDRLILCYT